MCLTLTKNWEDVRQQLRGRQEPIAAYKMLRVLDDGALESPDMGYKWEYGRNISGRDSVGLTKEEKKYGEVQKGLHLFRSWKDAAMLAQVAEHRSFFQVQVNPADIVAGGLWILGFLCIRIPSIVVTECILQKEMKFRGAVSLGPAKTATVPNIIRGIR